MVCDEGSALDWAHASAALATRDGNGLTQNVQGERLLLYIGSLGTKRAPHSLVNHVETTDRKETPALLA